MRKHVLFSASLHGAKGLFDQFSFSRKYHIIIELLDRFLAKDFQFFAFDTACNLGHAPRFSKNQ